MGLNGTFSSNKGAFSLKKKDVIEEEKKEISHQPFGTLTAQAGLIKTKYVLRQNGTYDMSHEIVY
jgi:hypothetical protein